MAATMKSSFDPATHLHKQGWKGKGTALKEGHATRPLAVVTKKSLSGIGKDRDEAVPFWDDIFATTAASILSSTTSTANPSPATTPRMGSPSTWASIPQPRVGVSTQARISREVARRGLYSRFFKGKPVEPTLFDDEEEVDDQKPVAEETIAGPSSAVDDDSRPDSKKRKSKGEDGKETKEERKARKAEKAVKKAEKELKRPEKEAKKEEVAKKAEALTPDEKESSSKRKRARDATDQTAEVSKDGGLETGEVLKKRKKDKEGKRIKKSKKTGETEE